MGRIGIYLGLNDFFVMNPLFDKVDQMLPFFHSSEFLDLLIKWPSMGSKEKEILLEQQRHFVAKIFAPVNHTNVLTSLSGNCS